MRREARKEGGTGMEEGSTTARCVVVCVCVCVCVCVSFPFSSSSLAWIDGFLAASVRHCTPTRYE